MLRAEAVAIGEVLLQADPLSPILNVGSSTAQFRETDQPWIDELVFAPLRMRGSEVDHLDMKAARGVDLVGDIRDPALRQRLVARGYRCVILANVLEHVRDRQGVAAACEEIAGPGGLILATAPHSYPYHADPLDTGYRPSPDDLAALFRRCEPREVRTIVGPTYAEALQAEGGGLLGAGVRSLAWLAVSPARPRSARARLHRWRWYRRPYTVSLALLEVR